MMKLTAFLFFVFISIFHPTNCLADTKHSTHAMGIGVQTVTFFDNSRNRPIITQILYPTEQNTHAKIPDDSWKREPESWYAPLKSSASNPAKKYPLIMMSHGYRGDRLNSVWLAYALVKAGYIVASVDHYGESWYLSLPHELLMIWDRPLDISFVARAILNHSFLKDNIDPNKIGFAGFSYGGLTGIWLAGGIANLYKKPSYTQILKNYPDFEEYFNGDEQTYNDVDFSKAHKSYHDPLIKAVFLMAPAGGAYFDTTTLKNITIPVYIVTGASDNIVNPKENAEYFAKNIPNATLNVLPGKAGHFVFLNEPSAKGKHQLAKAIIQDDPSVNREKIHEEVSKDAINFFNSTLNVKN